jgi:hypothetical protein
LAQSQLLIEAALHQRKVRVTLVTRAFCDKNSRRAQAQKSVDCRTDEERIRVHFHAGNVLYQVGLEQDRPPFDVESKEPQASKQQVLQALGVV